MELKLQSKGKRKYIEENGLKKCAKWSKTLQNVWKMRGKRKPPSGCSPKIE